MNPEIEVTEDQEAGLVILVLPTGRRGRSMARRSEPLHIPMTKLEAVELVALLQASIRQLR